MKDAAAYPETFSGKVGENIYKFFEKMKEAFESNQVAEKDRVGILMKHLGGSAKGLITNSDKTLAEAEASLVARYGSAVNIWKGNLETFKRKCNNPKVWSSYGHVIARGLRNPEVGLRLKNINLRSDSG